MAILFSVIMPVFNRAAKVRRAIESVKHAAQHAQVSVEIVVIDDASGDDSAATARAADADVVLQLEANVGVTGARNRGIKVARGDYLIILDSDDELAPDAFVKIIAHFERHPTTDIMFGVCMDRAGEAMHRTCARMGPMTYEYLLAHGAAGEFMPVVRRKVFQALSFEEELRGFEGITWLKAARSGFALYYSSEILRIYDKEGSDRLCRRENMLHGAHRLAKGWHRFLTEFGADLWRLNLRSYVGVVVRWAVYDRLQSVTGPVVTPEIKPIVARVVASGLRTACACVPRSVWSRYYTAR